MKSKNKFMEYMGFMYNWFDLVNDHWFDGKFGEIAICFEEPNGESHFRINKAQYIVNLSTDDMPAIPILYVAFNDLKGCCGHHWEYGEMMYIFCCWLDGEETPPQEKLEEINDWALSLGEKTYYGWDHLAYFDDNEDEEELEEELEG